MSNSTILLVLLKYITIYLNGLDILGLKILKKDYLLEVPRVLLKTLINSRRNADNWKII